MPGADAGAGLAPADAGVPGADAGVRAVDAGEGSTDFGVRGADAPDGVVYLADGVSCRTQADAFVGVEGLHLAQVLAARLER